jgi:predicted nucleic acid-binding protein
VSERITFDTNLLIYALDMDDPIKQEIADKLVQHGPRVGAMLTTIVIGEFFCVATRKSHLTPMASAQRVEDFIALFPTIPYDSRHLKIAAHEAASGRFSFWDAVMLASAEEAGCTVCFSEDMADGARLGAITVRNPFGPRGFNEEARAYIEMT